MKIYRYSSLCLSALLIPMGIRGASQSLIYFESPKSVLSREVREDALTDHRVRDHLARLRFERVNTDSSEGMQRAIQANVPWTPTFVLFAEGKELRRAERIHTPAELLTFLDGKQVAQAGAGQASGMGGATSDAVMACMDDNPNDAPSGDLDVLRVCASLSDKLRVRVDVSDSPSVQTSPRFNIFIDSDDNEDTGYATATFKGADYVIQGGFLYKFSGNNSVEWKFDQVSAVTVEVKGSSLRFSVPANLLKPLAGEVRLWVGSQTSNWQPADWAPEGSPLIVTNKASSNARPAAPAASQGESAEKPAAPASSKVAEQSSPTSKGKPAAETGGNKGTAQSLTGENVTSLTDPQGDASDPTLDLVGAELAESADKLTIKLKFAATPKLDGIHIFINADGDDATGYSDGTRSGADFMVEGTTFFKHQKNAGTGWGWDQLGSLTPGPQGSGNSVIYVIPKSRIGLSSGKKIKMWFATTDAKWNTADTLPDGAPFAYPEK
ncbi:MAG: thioredoxin family protein [Candidatus Sumerlaeaceae bacterium]